MKTALVLSLLIPLSAFSASSAYEMADLKALDKDQSYRELVDHLLDILPSKRDAEWKAIAERACVAVIDPNEVKDAASAQKVLDRMDELMKKFGWLNQSKTFLSRRADVGLKAMGWTYSNSRHSSSEDPWLDNLKAFVAADQQTADLPLRALKLLKPGGTLATFCCSHHIDAVLFQNVILDAAYDARKLLRKIATYTHSPDHPVIPSIPETEYLKGYAFELASSR